MNSWANISLSGHFWTHRWITISCSSHILKYCPKKKIRRCIRVLQCLLSSFLLYSNVYTDYICQVGEHTTSSTHTENCSLDRSSGKADGSLPRWKTQDELTWGGVRREFRRLYEAANHSAIFCHSLIHWVPAMWRVLQEADEYKDRRLAGEGLTGHRGRWTGKHTAVIQTVRRLVEKKQRVLSQQPAKLMTKNTSCVWYRSSAFKDK